MEAPQNTPIAAVLNLQTYLRQIAYDPPGMTQPPVNGIFGLATQRALEEFQASRDLPVTGVADQTTWEALFEAYEASLRARAPREKMDIFPRTATGAILEIGSRGFAVAATQFMLLTLEKKYGSIGPLEVTGDFTRETGEAVKAFQRCNDLSPTGTVTDAVWDAMVRQYNVLFIAQSCS